MRQDIDLPKVTLDDGAPTPASLKALIDAVAKYEGQDPGSVRFNYFKTSDAETMTMRAYIAQQEAAEATASGAFCDYSVIGDNCANFALSALTAGGAITTGEANSLDLAHSTIPDLTYGALSGLSAFSMNEFDLLDRLNKQACVSVSDSASGYHSSGCQP